MEINIYSKVVNILNAKIHERTFTDIRPYLLYRLKRKVSDWLDNIQCCGRVLTKISG